MLSPPHRAPHARSAIVRATPRRPQGQPTRGKTRPNRLRHVDTFVARYDAGILRRSDGPWANAWLVDLGYGAEAWTAVEMATRLRRVNPQLPLLGVELDPLRVAAAQPFADERTHFRLGGFNLPLQEPARLVRAMNVLRQYSEAEVAPAWALMGAPLLPGGLLIEGTSDPLGRRWVLNVLRKEADGALRHEALVFRMTLREPFDPATLQPLLPKNLIHRMVEGEAIANFFQAWKLAAQMSAAQQVWGPRRWFVAAAEELVHAGWRVDRRRAWLEDGYLIVRGLEKAKLTIDE